MGRGNIDGERLLGRLEALAVSAAGLGGGVTRLAWSEHDVRGRALVASWLEGAGIASRIDAVGNLIAELPGTDPKAAPLVTGSHLDTVENGGRLDGAYGVVAGVEVLAALATSATLRHPMRLVAWANEEGVVAPPFTGSLAASGVPLDLTALGADGRALGERIAAGGGAPSEVSSAAWGPIAGYVELHIEQGPVLDQAGLDIGIVTGITGCRRGFLSVSGRANHAGTTPMDMRHDALAAAAHIVLAVRALAGPGPTSVAVATVGALRVTPGNANVVPGTAEMSYDLRSLDDAACDEALRLLDEAAARVATETGTTVRRTSALASAAVATDARWRAALAAAAAGRGLTTAELASGAGHDAQNMVGLGPVGMLFVPSVDGVSHAPDEATSPEHLVAGAEVLFDALRLADDQLS